MNIRTETSHHRPERSWTEDSKKYADGWDFWQKSEKEKSTDWYITGADEEYMRGQIGRHIRDGNLTCTEDDLSIKEIDGELRLYFPVKDTDNYPNVLREMK